MNRKIKMLVGGALVMLVLAACAQAQAPSVAPERVQALEAQVNELEGQIEAMGELESRVEQLEAKLEGPASETQPEHGERGASPFEVAVAQYILDTAGFHGIDERLSESGEINPADLGTAGRVHKVLASTTWPEELEAEAADLLTLLEQLEAALEADDAEAAAELAAEVHGAQHDFSHSIDAWQSGEEGGHHE